ncbi:hypothetical protein QUW33_01095 [Lactobacillus gallinarum]|uniref:hypothetical protein n=1 Tax=Lactobacillus gallinarum TaxID=52242 RepID=UPI00195EF3A2|nr:hypothetical protein [Lactobacillus gallinarum]MBM6957978.1 hypothetical protein [Lactobacillus gallinarum]MDM8276048.1 hypothetical protein [Lactobacillus gallinarum]
MATLVTYGVFVFIAIMGIVQILISNSVMKQTAGNKGDIMLPTLDAIVEESVML